MGKFEGFLICSDLDGTFRQSIGGDPESGRRIIEKNEKAIRYFTEEGGRFSFATGRMFSHLTEHNLSYLMNAPTCLCNGSLVYDHLTETVLRDERVPYNLATFTSVIKTHFPIVEGFYICNDNREDNMLYIDCKNEHTIPQELLPLHPIKIVCCFETEEDADIFKSSTKALPFFADSYISKSWNTGVEFNSCLATKGHALDFIKTHLGNIHTAVGIGDYENDIPMLIHADIGVAVENAMDIVKEHADAVVCANTEGAIAHLIEYLETKV